MHKNNSAVETCHIKYAYYENCSKAYGCDFEIFTVDKFHILFLNRIFDFCDRLYFKVFLNQNI